MVETANKTKIYSSTEIRNLVLPIIQKYKAKQAVLFGSYARNEARQDSDIDVMVIGGAAFEPTDIFCIADDLFNTTNKSVDVYEEREIDRHSEFYKTIMREGILW